MVDAAPTLKLHELIKRTASRLGDAVLLEATGGSTTTFVDTLNIPPNSQELTRRQIMFTSGSNEGVARSISDTTQATSTLTFTALSFAISAGVTAFCVNAKAGGFTLLEYKEHINEAIGFLRGISRPAVVSSNLTVDSSAPTLAIPTTMSEVYAVEWLNTDGITWRDLSGSSMRGGDGWWIDEANQVVILDPWMANQYHGMTVRLRGDGKHGELSTYTSTTRIHPGFLVPRAAYTLALMGVDRDIHGSRKQTVLQFEREYQAAMSLVRTRREPTSVASRQD